MKKLNSKTSWFIFLLYIDSAWKLVYSNTAITTTCCCCCSGGDGGGGSIHGWMLIQFQYLFCGIVCVCVCCCCFCVFSFCPATKLTSDLIVRVWYLVHARSLYKLPGTNADCHSVCTIKCWLRSKMPIAKF